ncbi:hypothetical protein M1271_00950 [Patescibacteria group bacterium]|nr:hypothetical protein [Patescibacteria group bacterium]
MNTNMNVDWREILEQTLEFLDGIAEWMEERLGWKGLAVSAIVALIWLVLLTLVVKIFAPGWSGAIIWLTLLVGLPASVFTGMGWKAGTVLPALVSIAHFLRTHWKAILVIGWPVIAFIVWWFIAVFINDTADALIYCAVEGVLIFLLWNHRHPLNVTKKSERRDVYKLPASWLPGVKELILSLIVMCVWLAIVMGLGIALGTSVGSWIPIAIAVVAYLVSGYFLQKYVRKELPDVNLFWTRVIVDFGEKMLIINTEFLGMGERRTVRFKDFSEVKHQAKGIGGFFVNSIHFSLEIIGGGPLVLPGLRYKGAKYVTANGQSYTGEDALIALMDETK